MFEADDIRARDVAIDDDQLRVGLMDGRRIAVPIAWFPRLAPGDASQRARWELAGAGYRLHWPDLDENVSTESLLQGGRAPRGSAAWRRKLAPCPRSPDADRRLLRLRRLRGPGRRHNFAPSRAVARGREDMA